MRELLNLAAMPAFTDLLKLDAPVPLLVAVGVATAALLVAVLLLARRGLRTFGRVATAGLGKARSGEDPATEVLAWIIRYVFFTFGGGLILSASYGMIRFLTEAGVTPAVAVAVSFGVEGLMLGFTADLYHRSRTGRPTVPPRVASWAFAGVSAYANYTHPIGGVAFLGLMPLLGLFAIEWQAGTERRENREQGDGKAGVLTRFLRATWGRVWAVTATRLGVDINASDTDVERALRVRKAGRLAFRYRHSTEETRRAARLERRLGEALDAAGAYTDPQVDYEVRQWLRGRIGAGELARDPGPHSVPWLPRETDLSVLAVGGQATDKPVDKHAALTRRANGQMAASAMPPSAGDQDGQADSRRARAGQGSGQSADKNRMNRRTRARTGGGHEPDITDLIRPGQDVYRDLHAVDPHVTRGRLTAEMRVRGYTVGGDRAAALWRALGNGHAPAFE